MPSDKPDLDAERDVDLSRHWGSITRHWWLPLGGLAAGIIVGYLISLGGAQVYKAKAVVYLGQPLSQGGVQVQSQATNPSTVKEIVTAESTIREVARDAGLRPKQLRGRISTQAVAGNISRLGQNPLVAILVTGHARRPVARAANDLARKVVFSTALAALNKQIKAQQQALSTASGLSTTDRLILGNQISSLLQQQLTITDQLTTNQQQL